MNISPPILVIRDESRLQQTYKCMITGCEFAYITSDEVLAKSYDDSKRLIISIFTRHYQENHDLVWVVKHQRLLDEEGNRSYNQGYLDGQRNIKGALKEAMREAFA